MIAPVRDPKPSPASLDVLRLLAEGYPQREVARIRGTSLDTVHRQVERLRDRLGAKSTPHAVAIAMRSGWLL